MRIRDDGASISSETYRALRTSILAGKIAPGTKVTTPDLCRTFNASLGAIREALSRLRAEGLIAAEAHRGFTVAPISVDDLRDLTRMRVDIECLCLARSIEHGDFDWEGGIISSAHRLARAYEESRATRSPGPALTALHSAFHRALVSACGSPRLLRMREQLFDEYERYRYIETAVAPNRNPAAEHVRIAEATVARDVKRAQKLLAEHISCTAEHIIEAMAGKAAASLKRTAAGPVTKNAGTPRARKRRAVSFAIG